MNLYKLPQNEIVDPEHLQGADNLAKVATQNRVVIHGWYGIPNVGDEAILASIVADFRKLKPNLHITVFCSEPEYTLKHHDVENTVYVAPSLTKEQQIRVISELRKTDLFVLGGGGMFHSHSGRRPWLQTMALAKLLGCQTMLYVVGIDPSSMAKRHWGLLWRLFCRFADIITVRDPGSQTLLHRAGIKKPVAVVPDPVFRLEPSPAAAVEPILMNTLGEIDKPLVSLGVGMPPYRFGPIDRLAYIEIMAGAGDYLVEKFGARILLIPYDLQPGRDREISLEIVGMMKHRDQGYVLLDNYPPDHILALNNYMDLSLCTRFHSLIFAIITNTPFVSIVYQQKVGELIKEAELTDFGININELTLENLIEKIDFVWHRRDILSQQLAPLASGFAMQALQAPETALRLLKNGKAG